MSENKNQKPEISISEQCQIRRDKLKDLQDAGRNPFLVERWEIDAYSADIKDNFEQWDGKEVSMAGRLMAKRVMGKAAFIDIQDGKRQDPGTHQKRCTGHR